MHLIALIAIIVVTVLLLTVLFEPPLRYAVTTDLPAPDSPEFLRLIAALADAQLHQNARVEILSDGAAFYPAELEAISRATRSVHVEAFIFHPSPVGQRFVDALAERARNGVSVKVVIDAVGSFPTPNRFFDPLRQAGGRVVRYQPLRFGTLKRLNNRTHRELIVIDGCVAFVGGAGIANHWDVGDSDGRPSWRDLMFRVDDGLATGLQTTFAENWLESSSEILADAADFPPPSPDPSIDQSASPDAPAGFIVISTPTAGRSTRSRASFQTLIAAARHTVAIHSPYFLPDRSATAELVRAAARGVRVRVIVPGSANNHRMTRLASRRRYGPLLAAGVEIHEYQPGMIHTKALTVDALWVVVGTTNFDSRSFDLNDEVNLIARDPDLANRLEQEFTADLSRSQQITLDRWRHRSLAERVAAQLGRVLERQE